MNDPAPPPMRLAGLWRRAAARAIDSLVRAVGGFGAYAVAGSVAIVIAQPDWFSGEGWGTFHVLTVLFGVPLLLTVFGFEVVSTARRGQTFGKKCMGIRVVQWRGPGAQVTDGECPDPRGSVARFGVPHLTGVVVGVSVGVASGPGLGGWAVLVGADAGLAAWMLVYASSLWDPDGRGWHDKLAGTVVVLMGAEEVSSGGDTAA